MREGLPRFFSILHREDDRIQDLIWDKLDVAELAKVGSPSGKAACLQDEVAALSKGNPASYREFMGLTRYEMFLVAIGR